MTLRVAVVQGGPSAEAAVSRASAQGVADALEHGGHRATRLELGADTAGALLSGAFDVVFPVVHGPLGEDGCLQGLLEVLGLPYVGSRVRASAIGADKPTTKLLMRERGVPVAAERLVRPMEISLDRACELRRELGPGLAIKPSGAGSALGVTLVKAEEPDQAVLRGLETAAGVHAEVVLVEPLLAGQETTCGVLEDDDGVARALPPTLIEPVAGAFYDYRAKYARGGSRHVCPAPFAPSLGEMIARHAVEVHRALGARDLSRVDFIVDAERGTVTALEINTLPGMTRTSLFPEAAAAAGISFPTLCDRLVRRAATRAPDVVVVAPALPD